MKDGAEREEASCFVPLKRWIETHGGFIHPHIYIADCPAKGRGVFSSRDIKVHISNINLVTLYLIDTPDPLANPFFLQ